jgi:predicted transcriptional regulator
MDTRTRRRRPDTPSVRFTLRLPTATVTRADDIRWRLRLRSRAALITRAVDEFVERHDTPTTPAA